MSLFLKPNVIQNIQISINENRSLLFLILQRKQF